MWFNMTLQETQTWLTDFFGMPCSHVQSQAESQEYQAMSLQLGTFFCYVRTAKITPTKVGQFVTFWKRSLQGPIAPFEAHDQFDFLLVVVEKNEMQGVFVFSKQVLIERNIISHDGREGKRAIRVYPPWDVTDSKQAKATQAWQLRYFFKQGVSDARENLVLQKILKH